MFTRKTNFASSEITHSTHGKLKISEEISLFGDLVKKTHCFVIQDIILLGNKRNCQEGGHSWHT